MRSLITAVGLVAMVNLIALAGVGGFLVGTGKLDKERAGEIRRVLLESPADREIRLAAIEPDEGQPEAQGQSGEAEGEGGVEGLTIEELNQRANERMDVAFQARSRGAVEAMQLRENLQREWAVLEEDKSEFLAEKAAFEALRREIRETEGRAQFTKALGVLEGLKAPEAVANLREMLDDGMRVEVVSYLNSMDGRQRTKIFAEMTKDGDVELAAQLLDDLRTRGVETPEPEDPAP